MSRSTSHNGKETTGTSQKIEGRAEDPTVYLGASKGEDACTKDKATVHQAPSSTPAFINNCPPEVLAIVFKLAISGNPTHVRRILLVCKQWHHLVTDDPQMWNVINLTVPEACWDIRGWARSVRQFVKKSLERSQPAPLDISLDFGYLKTTRQQIAIKLDNSIWDLPGAAHPEVIQRRIQKLREHDDEGPGSRLMVCEPEHALDLINELVGPNGISTARWRTLDVVFPIGDIASRLWNLLIYPFPNLYRVSFVKLSRLGTIDWGAKHAFNYFPQVEQLHLDVDGDFNIFSLFPISLRNLSVRTAFGSEFPRQLSRFTQLRILSINAGMGKLKDRTKVRLSLPLLQDLNLVGNFQPTISLEFDVPQLTHLLIEWSWRWKFTKNMPSVQPSYLRWAPIDEPQGESDFELAQKSMRDFLLHFTTTGHFTAPHHMRAILFQLVKELSLEGSLAPAWKTLSFRNGWEIVETVEVSEVVK
jgi:hypothetical protein